ncbi:response regulator [Flavobacterium sp.]|uniref:response regulator n=1 Tax=Flavobacterium sp. TaxID=239 RepID=UPI003750A989
MKKINHILLADDDKADHILFEKAFKDLNVPPNITIVNDGEELIKYLTKHSEQLPDIIFLDLNMPRKNGFESLVEIREIEKLKDLSIVIFSTSFPQDKNYELGMISNLFKLGANVFIRKANNFEQLKHVILQALPLATENTGIKYILNA